MFSRRSAAQNRIFLEELDFASQPCPAAAAWAQRLAEWLFAADTKEWQKVFKERFLVVPDDVFAYLCETGTEVNARCASKKTPRP